jgi:hypothetical protein
MTDDAIAIEDVPVLDWTTITLGEMADMEAESGRPFERMMTAGKGTQMLIALWLTEHRADPRSASYVPPRSWHELRSLRPLASTS